MPTHTFFRLPEEKRQRLTEAAWGEFSRCSFAEASINQIVQNARVSRGSFYQYFADKEDLFFYLLEGSRDYFFGVLRSILEETGGDLFALPLAAFDRFVGADDPVLEGFHRVVKLNRDMDLQRCFRGEALPEGLWERIDRSLLRRDDREFAEKVTSLLLVCTAAAILTTIETPENRDHERRLLADRVDILAYGSLKSDTLFREEEAK